MDEVSPFAELLGQVIYHLTAIKPLVPTYAHLLVSALFPIYIGAHASLSKPSSAAKPQKEDDDESNNEDDEGQGKMETLQPSDALMFPLTAGFTLGGLYLVINYMGAELLNKILGFYFSQMGMFFACAFLKDALSVLRSFVFPRTYTYGDKLWKVKQSDRVFKVSCEGANPETSDVRHSPFPGIISSIPLSDTALKTLWAVRNVAYRKAKVRLNIYRICRAETSVDALDLFGFLLALPAVGYFTFVAKPWWLTNFLGFSFSYGALQFMSPSTFVTGSLILGSLFFYDIYFVFFTPLMVTVAKSLDMPIKLLFPRPSGPDEPPDTVSLAMLGLGDVVIPGMMVGLALRFDLHLYYVRKGFQKARAEGNREEFIKPVYQSATGGWGDRFWTRSIVPKEPELEPPYHDARVFPKTYFRASIIGYVAGMIATLVVMQCFDHPQPALLYLVPGVLISLWGTAAFKGEIKHMWHFSDGGEDDDEEKEEEETDAGKEEEKSDEGDNKNIGLFRQFFTRGQKFSNKKPQSEKSSKVTGNEKNDEANDKESDTDGKKERGLDLFSVSLYLPRKASSSKPAKTEDSTDDATSSSNGAQFPDDEENWAVIGAQEQLTERPAKRQRKSPRHAAKAIDN
ncbi:hypothetical protein EYZ11_001417 [Aspergillus tanneri]|uniref:Signal peptide peptidase n=1 Tax=Aspergillus tanneri TaxID=1220188 RepID=A0A4S3JUN2_9EURO|nr:uncharacterized protein ATNIH1004_010232 [Aspergillus tanneri]KAA8643463.1 hypothetical protein ATNIH1004_010232 [Aspergillus tanneri]THC99096.1 hypothetical protein EYZ11_001417 [Aspergillus tanneri]